MISKSVFSFLAIALLFMATLLLFSFQPKKQKKVLVFSKTLGYYHKCIPDGLEAIKKMGKQEKFMVEATTDSTWFREEVLRNYDAVIFLNTTGNVLGPEQEKAFENYIRGGGGFVGIHSATDTEYDWAWYGQLVGGYFESHPEQQTALLRVLDNSHLSTRKLPKEWKRRDEWYNFKNLNKNVNVGIVIDETSYKGGKNGSYHPVSWWHEFEGGRAFYTALGHTSEAYSEPLFLEHLKGGIFYAIRKGKK